MVIAPVGSETVRKIAASTSERTSMFCIHSGIAARAATKPATTQINSKEVFAKVLRDDFNLHLLRADIVGNIFRSYGQTVEAGRQFAGYRDLPSAC